MNSEHVFVVLAYKESPYLCECIESLLNQTIKSKIVIATSSLNNYIKNIAQKYNLEIIENKSEKKGIAVDFEFGYQCVPEKLVTVAHQDDIYEPNYAEEIMNRYSKNPQAIILFSDYYEIRNKKKIYDNKNLRIKKILLKPLKNASFKKMKFFKRRVLSFGNSICCPSVTYNKENITYDKIFDSDFKSNVDWYAWEKLSKLSGSFEYIALPLMGHRVHNESTTTEIINDHTRTKEDYVMLKKFWPQWIAKMINKFYSKAEESNNV